MTNFYLKAENADAARSRQLASPVVTLACICVILQPLYAFAVIPYRISRQRIL
jgi:hypothetical protein